MAGVNGATGQVIAFADEWIAAADAFFPLVTDPDVAVEGRLGLFIPLSFSLE